uniref:Ethanolaminephosphotransferase 1 n=1 Tax=Ciona intestinalis TaxID=7719 RepID=F7A160_CIOIN|nr:ethanolaminephosphotransferase 1 [Ciona intestinalis]|eukprot:XP_002125974.2 ethanolaminephosphotransferase 1 [Ciona intestinalis]
MYITEQELSGFDTYKYSCKDTSPLSNYVMHPFWNEAVKLFPRWLAPNVMTFGGFVLLILQYILLWYFDPTYYASTADIAYPPIPTWVWWFSLFAQFFSHTLDGCDGKQARRTGTSSPLGELFDHGIDSWCVSLFTLNILSVFGRDLAPVSLMYSVQCMTLMTFLLSHWEKYNTGILFLPWAYDLSQVLMAIVYFITAVSGVGVWRGTLLGYEVTILFKVVLYVATFGFAVPMCLYNIYIANKNGTGKNLTFYEGSLPLLSPLLSFTILTTWIYISPSNVLSTNPRIFMLIISVLFSNILCRLIVSQMSNTRCQVFNKFVFFIGAGFAVTLYFHNPVIENYILLTLAIGLTVAHIHYAITVVNKLAAHFGIKVFSIKQDSD